MPRHTRRDPNQLKLMMTGQEWKNTVSDSVDLGDESMDELWEYKLDEAQQEHGAHGAGIHQSMLEHGYNPDLHSEYDKPTMYVSDKYVREQGSSGWGWKRTDEPEFRQGEGHHRIAAAAEIERTTGKPIWIPTNYR